MHYDRRILFRHLLTPESLKAEKRMKYKHPQKDFENTTIQINKPFKKNLYSQFKDNPLKQSNITLCVRKTQNKTLKKEKKECT